MTEEQQKEQFSIAYVRAVAATARINISRLVVDEDSIDIGFSVKSVAGMPVSPKLDAQLKCVTHLKDKDGTFRYPLKIKNYNELVGYHFVPRILIVVLIPPSLSKWINQTEECLSLYKCGYWASLRELPSSANSSTATVDIPRKAIFSPSALRKLLPTGESS